MANRETVDLSRGDALDVAKSAWAATLEGRSEEEGDRLALATAVIVRAIAAGGSVTPDALARQLGLDSERAREIVAGLTRRGLEVDDSGNIVGCALTSTRTPHAVRLGGPGGPGEPGEPGELDELGARELFAWCALDTLFIPGLLGEPADIESSCPASGEAIQLRISPDGACEYTPRGAVLSVFLPGASSLAVGPASPT